MKKGWLLALSLAAVLILLPVVLTGCGLAEGQLPSNLTVKLADNQPQGISVSGLGKVTAVPDVATLSLGISSQAATVAEAQSQAIDAMNKVMDALTGNGVDKKDIQTQQFSIQQVTRWDKDKEQEVVIGYRVTNIVVAKIRAIDNAGKVIDAVAAAGGDLTRINGISFTVDNPKPYQDQAREKAMNDAKAKAQQMASLSGVTLGKPTYISESSYIPTPMPAMYKEAAPDSAPTPISPGEMDITVNVQVVYAIQ